MNAWQRWLASVGLGIFVGYETHEFEKTLHPRDPLPAPGVWSASYDFLIEHIEPIFPAMLPPPPEPPVNQNWVHHDVARARWSADRIARVRAANADFYHLMAARGGVLRSPDHVSAPA